MRMFLKRLWPKPNHLVDTLWAIKIKSKCLCTLKIKVGFGPITSGENDLAERKWRIDPIINQINTLKHSRYTAGFFINTNEMRQFDIIIIVKKFTQNDIPIIEALKKKNKRFIYDIVDNPNAEAKYATYFADCPEFSSLMDGFILSSPLHDVHARKFSHHTQLIEHPIINHESKTYQKPSDTITILAHGYHENIKNISHLEPIIRSVAQNTNQKIMLVYHSEVVLENTEDVRYVQWSVANCFTQIIEADIVLSIKNLHLKHQRTKPSTKIITMMAAGVPVICKPTQADLCIINHGVTGFFAYTHDDWTRYITLLVTNAKRRRQMAMAAKNHVDARYSIAAITKKYLEFLEQVR